ncbi:hypothetical protein FQN54_009944 [Arachnomyces sp. PD_36]|nr:hypothetical protein FQN54_009944 [Arachnomyces sp. PD_36]
MVAVTREQVLQDHRHVLRIRLVVHYMEIDGTSPSGPPASENHWSLFFIVSDESSVRANMSAPDLAKRNGELVWENHNYILTNSAISYWDFEVTAMIRVAEIASLFDGLARHDYDMAPGGSGCRWWCYTVLGDLEEWGYIKPGSQAGMLQNLNHKYYRYPNGHRVPHIMPEGEFFPRSVPIAFSGSPGQTWVSFNINNRIVTTPLNEWILEGNPQDGYSRRHHRYNLFFIPPM